MAHFFLPTGVAGDGAFPSGEGYSFVATNVSGSDMATQTVAMLTLTSLNAITGIAEVDNDTPGSSDATNGDNNSGWNTIVLPTAASLSFGLFVVLQEAIANDASGKVSMWGYFDATVPSTAVWGDGLCPTDASGAFTESDGTQNAKIIAIPTEEGSGTTKRILFNGFTGFGFDTTV